MAYFIPPEPNDQPTVAEMFWTAMLVFTVAVVCVFLAFLL